MFRRWWSTARPEVELLVREGCHLCEMAEHEVRRVFGAEFVGVIDIASSRALEDEFVFRIPVLRVDDLVLAEGQIGRKEARQALRRAQSYANGKGP